MEKVSVFIKIRVLFWPDVSALGVFLKFDNEGAQTVTHSAGISSYQPNDSAWCIECMCPSRRVLQPVYMQTYTPSITDARH